MTGWCQNLNNKKFLYFLLACLQVPHFCLPANLPDCQLCCRSFFSPSAFLSFCPFSLSCLSTFLLSFLTACPPACPPAYLSTATHHTVCRRHRLVVEAPCAALYALTDVVSSREFPILLILLLEESIKAWGWGGGVCYVTSFFGTISAIVLTF